ncbi:helix-turn-helix domain-containing protein [Cytophagaceae bacterium YF14B1]|uniref:Helix-turn-helix domain-containing protein n=1 Tax=Xanthocytophaga flava TaxID=3048013 RepID=A0AAE3UAH9_9BACT|nr:helix-turn-helix domain-containing protein [Xanthocytophaga flavus]MDJ1486149.1 helix-turn-helix domain-containing protein [Xanthocytophaga flavus]
MDFDLEAFSPALFYLAGVFIACFSSFLLLGKRKKVMADYLLAVWFLVIGIHLIFFLFLFSSGYVRFPHFLGLEIPLPLIHGPMLYLYIICLTNQYSHKKIWLLHLVPPLIIYVILLDFFLLSPQEKIYVYEHNGSTYKMQRDSINILIVLSGILYVTLSILAIRKYKRLIAELYSNTEKINLDWGYYLITSIALIWIAVILKYDILIFSLVVLFILLTAYFGINRVGILNVTLIKADGIEGEPEAENNPVTAKYQKTFVNKDTIQNIYKQLIYQMEYEKIYKDPELNLHHVAELLEVHPNILSQTINSLENKNFYDYINRHRIEEFKRIAVLPENQKFTLFSLALESGFNSKTSFNRNFKRYMHCSPREFLKNKNLNAE